jgi:SAM-dependent methyltransferase
MIVSNFNKEYLQYLFPQRTRLTTEYALTEDSSQDDVDRALCKMVRKDYHMIEQYLPIKCDSILDIGCGLALSDIAIYNHYKSHYSHDIDVYLLDKNEFDTTKISGFNKEYKGYNSMSAANDTLVSNGVPSDRIHMYETDDFDVLFEKKYDIITSFLSCGWHYDVSTYVDLFEQTLSDDGVLVLDIRHDTGQVETVKSKFNLHRQIYNHAESKHTGGNIGDRYIFTR